MAHNLHAFGSGVARMQSRFVLVAVTLLALPAFAADAPPPPAVPKMTAAECEVWDRERSFARSVDAHDTAAFQAHLHPGTVFFGGPTGKLVGVDAVAAGWKDVIAGGPQPLHWYPRQATIGGDPDVAHSIGPYWIEDTTPGAKDRFVVGQFISIWRKVDGRWLVLFDGGGGSQPTPATPSVVNAAVCQLLWWCATQFGQALTVVPFTAGCWSVTPCGSESVPHAVPESRPSACLRSQRTQWRYSLAIVRS